MLLFHSWWIALILRVIPGLDEILSLLPLPTLFIGLLWINIPGVPLHLLFGEPYFPAEEFGVLPQGVIGYSPIILFWIIVSILLGFATSALIGWLKKRRAARSAD
jgi:hypothetical protein